MNPAYKFSHTITNWFNLAADWVDPWWWVSTAALLFLITLFGVWPLRAHPEFTQAQAVAVVFRKTLLFLVIIAAVFPVLLFLVASGLPLRQVPSNFSVDFVDMLYAYWTLPVAAVISGYTAKFIYLRYGIPYVSAFIRRFRVIQSSDQESDIRREIGKYEPVNFIPSDYYKPNKVFLGLDEQDKPFYIALDDFRSTHMQIVGPTRSGKGVLLGGIVDQIIRRNDSVFLIDPKLDKFIPHIMAAAAEAAGRKFVYLDLNGVGQGKWAPFKGGDDRDRRARIVSAFNLQGRGTDADVYLARERRVVDQVMKTTNGSIPAMLDYIREHELEDRASRFSDGLREWAEVATFKPPKNKGFSIRRSLLENAVVYIRGSIKDHVIRDATRIFIIELMQEIAALKEARQKHLTVAVDEVRFVISDALVDALATVAGFGANIITAYQSILDLRNLPDKTMNALATEQSVNVNSQIKVLYRAPDYETAEWGARLSGTQFKTVARMEKTDIGRYGEEKWGDTRMMHQVEENIIAENSLLALKPRVAAVYQPGKLTSICRTSWVPVTKQYTPKESANKHTETASTKQEKEVGAESSLNLT